MSDEHTMPPTQCKVSPCHTKPMSGEHACLADMRANGRLDYTVGEPAMNVYAVSLEQADFLCFAAVTQV